MRKESSVFAFIFCLLTLSAFSQIKGIVVDKETRQPVSFVSIYTKDGDKICGAMSNKDGLFFIDFPFQTLFISHVNYQKMELKKEMLGDTIFLTPASVLLSELVVSNKQPRWIPGILREVVRLKTRNYQNQEKQFPYTYDSYTLGDSSGYAFQSKGNLRVPKLSANPQYYIDAQKNIIKYKDKTAGVDFTNLKTMLYGDFMTYFDNRFIANNTFRQNTSFNASNSHWVQLSFNDKKDESNNGSIVIDTLNKVIVESVHNTDTGYNLKNNTTLYFKVFAPKLGIKHDVWITKSHTKYSKQGNSYYIAESTYKFSMQSTVKSKKGNSHYFTTIESGLSLHNPAGNTDHNMIPLLKPMNTITILTKKMQREEAALNKVFVTFEKF